jgi:hypothetical protein
MRKAIPSTLLLLLALIAASCTTQQSAPTPHAMGASSAQGSACPWMIQGYVPTVAQWQQCWQMKQDVTGGVQAIDLVNGTLQVELPNSSTTGTTVNSLAKLTASPSSAVIAATTDSGSVIGVVVGETTGAQIGVTAGNAIIAVAGQAVCSFDGGVTAGDYVQISSSVAGDCHDGGASWPGSGQVLGRVLSGSGSGAGAYSIYVFPAESRAATTGGAANPGGSSGQIQFNSGGTAFGGFTAGGDATVNTGTGVVTVTKTSGTSFAASATTDTTNAANISSGTLPAARLPNPSASTLGGTESIAPVAHNYLTSISTSGVPAQAQPAFTDISGTLTPSSQMPTSGVTAASYTCMNGTVTAQGLLTAAANGSCGGGSTPPVAADGRNITITRASTTTATVSYDEFITETALNGTSYKNGSFSGTLNFGTTGAGGLDTGSIASGKWYCVYAIVNSTGPTWNVLAVDCATSSGTIYSGSSMPSGYTASALVGVLRTPTGTAQLTPTVQYGREVFFQSPQSIFSNTTIVSSFTSQSISAGVPPNAKMVSLLMGPTDNTTPAQPFAVAGDGTGYGVQFKGSSMAAAAWNIYIFQTGIVAFRNVPIITSQVVYWESNVSSGKCGMEVTGFVF